MVIFKKQFLPSYFFLDSLDDKLKKEILSIKNISLVYKSKQINMKEITKIKNFCKQNRIKIFIFDNVKIALQVICDGIVFPSNNNIIINKLSLKKNFKIIGIVHNQKEFFFKKRQNCHSIMLSPLNFNHKFKIKEILGPIKFNLTSLHWNIDLMALGGINFENVKNINLTKAKSIAFATLLKKNPPTN